MLLMRVGCKGVIEQMHVLPGVTFHLVGTHVHQVIWIGIFKCLIRFCPDDLSIVQGFCEV